MCKGFRGQHAVAIKQCNVAFTAEMYVTVTLSYMLLPLWACYVLYFPPDSCCKHKDHLQKNNKTEVILKAYWYQCLCFIYLLYGNETERKCESLQSDRRCLCNFSHHQRGEMELWMQLFSSPGPLTHTKLLNPLKRGVGNGICNWWYLFKAKASAQADVFTDGAFQSVVL